MLSAPLRSFILILLLLGGLAVFFISDFSPFAASSASDNVGDGYSYIADVDLWHRTNRETEVNAVSRFDLTHDLNDVPMEIGDWWGEERPETNVEVMILLDPEQYVQRLYWNSEGQHMWLTMIGGRSSQPFHPPDICYDVDGWNYNLSSVSIELDGGGRIYGMWMEAQKQFPERERPTDHIVFYFYLFPERTRQYQDGIVLFKLTSALYGDLDNTLAVHADFLRNFFTQASNAESTAALLQIPDTSLVSRPMSSPSANPLPNLSANPLLNTLANTVPDSVPPAMPGTVPGKTFSFRPDAQAAFAPRSLQ